MALNLTINDKNVNDEKAIVVAMWPTVGHCRGPISVRQLIPGVCAGKYTT